MATTLLFTGMVVMCSLSSVKSSTKQEIYGFYNIYAEGKYFKSIVNEQLFVLNASGLYDRLTQVFYVAIGINSSTFNISNYSKFKKVAWHYNGTEIETLLPLYKFCREQQTTKNIKVFYFHNKGSYHPSDRNTEFRRALDCYNLNTHCIDALGYLICNRILIHHYSP